MIFDKRVKNKQGEGEISLQQIDQWNRKESLEINPCAYGQLIYNKGGKNIQSRKDSLFNKWYWENCTATCIKKNRIRTFSNTIYTKSKCIKNLNTRPGTISS